MQEQYKRFLRQILFSPFGIEGQKKLSESSAAVIGVGGLGSWTAEFLVRMGIGRIRLCDDDRVEVCNLHRQALYNEKDAGQLKAAVAEKKLRDINSQCVIEALPVRIDHKTIYHAAADVDIILDGTDNFATRFLINDFAVKHSMPWVFAGVLGSEGQVMCIIPGKTACLRCVIGDPRKCCEEQKTLGQTSVMGAIVPFISSLQSMEAIKILSGYSQRGESKIRRYDLWQGCSQVLDVSQNRQDNNCRCCVQKKYEYLEPGDLCYED